MPQVFYLDADAFTGWAGGQRPESKHGEKPHLIRMAEQLADIAAGTIGQHLRGGHIQRHQFALQPIEELELEARAVALHQPAAIEHSSLVTELGELDVAEI